MILISIGANLPASPCFGPLDTCRQAVSELDQLPNLHVRGLSRWYDAAPLPPSPQPSYVNAVIHLEPIGGTQIDPSEVLERLKTIERSFGRVRTVQNAARTLDLDIIAADSQVRHASDLILPHPRAHLRAFVLIPLRDVMPHWVHPGLHKNLDDLIALLPDQTIRPLAGRG
jgi:2-amino-4-hydroxy-6-hydroxymethyldihydropteridine diphosphokinase